jgi:flagellar hook-associated protein 2
VVKGPEGRENGFIIEAAEDPANPGLAALAWTAGGDPARLLNQSRDAEFKLDGLPRTSPGNAVSAAAPGLNLDLKATNIGAPATITFAKSSAALVTVMEDMVGALNEIAGQLRSATDPLTGDLARDPGARNLARALAGLGSKIIMPNAPEGSPRTLTELGLATERDGSFRFDGARLTEAMARDPEAVAAMFTNGINGAFAEIDRLSRTGASTGDPGTLGGSIARYQALSSRIALDLANLAEKQEALRFSMVTRFAKADSQVAASKSTLSFLQSQIDVWNAQRD